MSDEVVLSHNLGLDLVRATEAAALAAGRWLGLGRPDEADRAASRAMADALHSVEMDGKLCLGDEARTGGAAAFMTGQRFGTGHGPEVDVLADAIDGKRLLAGGYPGAISAVAVAPRGAIRPLRGARYMEKIVVNGDVAPALVPECLDAPAAWTLALVARAKGKQVRDLVVFVLDRPRHADLVDEIRAAGSHVLLRPGGEISGALLASLRDGSIDVHMGTGGVLQALIATCAVKAAGGGMLGRLVSGAPGPVHRGGEPQPILSQSQWVSGSQLFFAATGVTDGPLFQGVRYHGDRAKSSSIILRAETHTRRTIVAEHMLHE